MYGMAKKRGTPKRKGTKTRKKATKNTKATKRTKARKKTAAKRSKATTSHEPTRGLYGWVTHTELASADPDATKAWCAAVLGWEFKPSFPTPGGDYHLFAYSDTGGGGIRRNNPPEIPGSIPYIHVESAQAAFDKALA